jgi:hypothetical protein
MNHVRFHAQPMNKTIIPILFLTLLFSACGVNQAFVLNQNLNTTHVQLGSNNFKVLERITGSAEVKYILCFGGMSKTRLYENAYADMLTNAKLTGSPKAIINVMTEEHAGGVVPFSWKRTVTVSALVIEFTR